MNSHPSRGGELKRFRRVRDQINDDKGASRCLQVARTGIMSDPLTGEIQDEVTVWFTEPGMNGDRKNER